MSQEITRYTAYDALMQAEHNGKYILAADHDRAIAGLQAKFDDPEYPPKHSRRLIAELKAERDAALALLRCISQSSSMTNELWQRIDALLASQRASMNPSVK